MIKVTYRLVGSVNYPELTKEFETKETADAWIRLQVNVLIISIESTGAAALSRIYGM